MGFTPGQWSLRVPWGSPGQGPDKVFASPVSLIWIPVHHCALWGAWEYPSMVLFGLPLTLRCLSVLLCVLCRWAFITKPNCLPLTQVKLLLRQDVGLGFLSFLWQFEPDFWNFQTSFPSTGLICLFCKGFLFVW